MLRSFSSLQNGVERILDANDVLANNMANINTIGYKQAKMVFKDMQEVAIKKMQNTNEFDPTVNPSLYAGSLSLGPEVSQMMIDFSQGDFITTDNKLDFAIKGDGFFVVQGPNNEQMYTRKGNFTLDANGFLTTTDGYKLLKREDNLPIKINMDNKDPNSLIITEDGLINYDKETLGYLKVVEFADKSTLVPIEGAMFRNEVAQNRPNLVRKPEIIQGALESSNANSISTMLKSIEASRCYESMTSAIQTTNDTLQKVINQTGRF